MGMFTEKDLMNEARGLAGIVVTPKRYLFIKRKYYISYNNPDKRIKIVSGTYNVDQAYGFIVGLKMSLNLFKKGD